MRSSMLLPRSRVGACSPSTHRIASTTFDLPHPLGPTTAVIPGAKPIVVESRKDLKPSSSRLLRRMLGVSDASTYKWKAKYGGMDVSEAKKLKTLVDENTRLKRLTTCFRCCVDTSATFRPANVTR